MGLAKDCFDNIVGFSRRDCDCFAEGRPDGETESSVITSRWEYQAYTAPEEPADPYTLTTTYDLPAAVDSGNVQLFAAGQLLTAGFDFEKTAARVLTITTPVPLASYQLWYKAAISALQTIPAYNYSLSGLHIADLIPEEMIDGLYKCEETLWQHYDNTKQVAIREFIAALNANLMKRNKPRYNTWAGFLGEAKGSSRLTTGDTYAGVRIRTSGLRSGYLRIVKFIAMFEDSGTLALTIYDGDGNVVTPAFNVTTSGGGKAVTPVNITLPLLGDAAIDQDYYIVYTYDADNRGILNKLNCGCSGNTFRPTPNVEAFRYSARDIRGANAWHNFIAIGGWTGDSVADFSSAQDEMSNYLNGLSVEVEIGCDMASGLCGLLNNFDANPYSNSVAVAIQRKWAAGIVGAMLRSVTPNRNLQVNREQLAQDAARWEGEFAEIIQYLSTNLPEGANDCVECRPRASVQGILT